MPEPSAASTSRSTTARSGSRCSSIFRSRRSATSRCTATTSCIATHGRAFWVMDDVTPLRQMSEAAAGDGAYLFAPATAYRVRPGNQEGTPLPLDEPQVDNAPTGLYVDYYLPDAPSTPVVIEILGADGRVVRSWSSAHPPKTVDPKTVPYTAHWIEQHPVPVAEAGAHRFVWDFHETDSHGPLVPPGAYTVRLSVVRQDAGRATARVMKDPRIAASRRGSARAVRPRAAHRSVTRRGRRRRARRRSRPLKGLSGERAQAYRREIVGEEPPDNPDDSEGSVLARLHELPLPGGRARLSRKRRGKRRRRADARHAHRRTRSSTAIYRADARALGGDREVRVSGRPGASARTSAPDRRGTARAPACADRPCGPIRRSRS